MVSFSSLKRSLAWIIVLLMLAATACSQTPAPSRPYDVVISDRDTTLNPLNPKWYSQVHDQRLPSRDLCGGAKPYQPGCTSQRTWADNSFLCSEGHRNWTWATYEGRVVWSGHESQFPFGDDDYNIFLFRRDAQERDDKAAIPKPTPTIS
jgi:hypothetical protein